MRRPPFVALALLLAAWAADYAMGAECVVPGPLRWVGPLAILAGLGLIAWPIALFRRAGTSHDALAVPSRLVSSGPYRFTRNPMYLGLTSILLGIGLLVGSIPFLAVPPIFLLLMNAFQVPREEARLEGVVGEEYRAYRRRVRRWL